MELKNNETYIRVQHKEDKQIIDIIKQEGEKQIWTHKEKPVEGKSTSSKIITTKDGIFCQGSIENT